MSNFSTTNDDDLKSFVKYNIIMAPSQESALFTYKLLDCVDPEKLNWKTLSGNTSAIDILEKNQDKIDWYWLSINKNAIQLLEKNPEKIF
jgi:hypothetical protein